MHASSPTLTATLRALHGETDVHVVASTLGDQQFARILALVPGVDPVIGALGALAGELPDLLTPDECASPALSAAIASLIGTDAGRHILPVWTNIAPAGWGASHAATLIDAVHHNRCEPWVAAALIGPCDVSAALLCETWDIARTVRVWGRSNPDDPTAWWTYLAETERKRLLDTLCATPIAAAECLPWLPEDYVTMVAVHIDTPFLTYAFDSYAEASSVAHAHHAAILSELIQRANPQDLDGLTRLAVASRMDAAWDAVVRLLGTHPWYAANVVAAASWDDLRTDVQDIFFPSAANHNDVCAAIAFARGMHDQPLRITRDLAGAFFASVTPTVWHALPTEMQQMWIRRLAVRDAHLAVRSLGIDPAFLVRAELNDSLVTAVRRHLRDDAAVQRTLLPVAVRALLPAAISDVVAALPTPPDPVAFIQIAGGSPTMPPALRAWITAHPTPQSMAAASTVLRATARLATDPVADRCAALAAALAGWSREETDALLAALPDDTHAALHPNADALTAALSHPDRRDAFRQALDAIDSLPPAATRPALFALGMLASAFNPDLRGQARSALAQALRDHGDCFLALVDALADEQRIEILPLPRSASHAAAVRAIAAADPLVAHHLAHALRFRNPTAALDALTEAPFDALTRIWRLLPKALQQFVLGDRDALLHNVAAPGCGDDLAQALQAWGADDPLLLLALRMLIGDSEERRAWGISALAQRPDVAAALLPLMHADARMLLERDSRIAIAGADLPPPRSPMPAPVRRRRR